MKFNYTAKGLICKYRTPGSLSIKGSVHILDLDEHGKPCPKNTSPTCVAY
jgi:hypothetical protein